MAVRQKVMDVCGTAAPYLTPLLVLLVLYWGSRRLYWRSRKAHKKTGYPNEASREGLPASAYSGYHDFEPVQQGAHAAAIGEQGDFYWRSGVAAALAPAALICLAMQLILFPEGGPDADWGIGLIAAELIILFYMIWFAWSQPQPSRLWLTHRVKSELLRREKYLHCCRVGPYFNLTEEDVRRIAAERAAEIADPDSNLARFAIDECIRGSPRIGRTETGDLKVLPDFPDRLATYIGRRVKAQAYWYSTAGGLADRKAERLSTALKLASVTAFAATGVHLVSLAMRLDAPFFQTIAVLCGFLPATGAFFTAIVSTYAYRFRADSYRYMQRLLAYCVPKLETTLEHARKAKQGSNAEALSELYAAAAVLIGAIEMEFLKELHDFTTRMEKREFEGGP
jgi:hypothetical protein